MTGADWLLALHLLSAVVLGAALTGFWATVLATRPEGATLPMAAVERLERPLTVAISIGAVGTLVFGVWLAILDDAYQVWDAWIVAAIVLWAAGMGLGQRAGTAFAESGPVARRRGLLLHTGSTVAILAVLVLMVWKPGA